MTMRLLEESEMNSRLPAKSVASLPAHGSRQVG